MAVVENTTNLPVAVEPDRMLARIVRISAILPIPKADKIEVAEVLGWEVVVRKDEFKVGALAIYFTIDSILDKTNPNTAFLDGNPLMTKKIRGVVSQGLLGPLSWLPNNVPSLIKEDDDVTNILNVKKFVPSGDMSLYSADGERAPFPHLVPKTEEERIQNMSRQLAKFEGKNVVLTQKFDGTSTTYVVINGKFSICGRNNTLLKETSYSKHYFEIAQRYNLEEKMLELNRNLAIQGEIIGPKISGNRHKVDKIEYYVFNIYDIDSKSYVSHDEVLNITSKLGIKTIDLVYRGVMNPEWLSVKTLLDLANVQRYRTGEMAEGLVLKTDYGIGYPRMSCKIISNNYLMKHNL